MAKLEAHITASFDDIREIVDEIKALPTYKISDLVLVRLSSVADILSNHVKAKTETERDFRDCRNELCFRCGEYRNRHNGACNGCRWLH